MFGGMMSDKASTAKLLASGNASVDTVLARMDLADHVSNNCHNGANLRYFLAFTEKNLPRILTAVQKPAGGPSAGITASASIPISTPSSRYFDGNDPTHNNTLLAARNATALLVKYCQCCTKNTAASNSSAATVDATGNPVSNSSKNFAVNSPNSPSPLGKVVPVMIGVFCRRGDLPESVALDVQRILLASIETDHETTLFNINITLRPDIVTGVVRHLSTSMIVSETLVSLFGSALNAKAMMVEVADPSAFVTKWIEHDFHIRLVNHLHSAMKNIDCAPYFFFFQEMLKRAFSPNVGPMVDRILMEECFGKLFDISVSAAEELLKVRKGHRGKGSTNLQTPYATEEDDTTSNATIKTDASAELIEGETPPITSIQGASSPGADAIGDEVDYPYLSEALNLVFQCVGIIRRSLPPPESEPVYMSRRLPLAHGPVHIMLRYLPRLVKVLRSSIPSGFRPSTYVIRRHRSVVEKLRKQREESGEKDSSGKENARTIGSTLISPAADADPEDEDVVRVGDDDAEELGDENGKNKNNVDGLSKDSLSTIPAIPKKTPTPSSAFGAARLAITDILVELTLFRSRVCDEALVASGAIEALLDCAEVFANHDLLLRNVHRVMMAVMQRPAYSAISLASNITAAIAASEAAQKSMAQHAGGPNVGGAGMGVGDKGGLGGNLSFASSTFENGQDSHPSFLGFDDFKRQYSSSSLCEDDSCANTMNSLDDELLFRGSISAVKGVGDSQIQGAATRGDATVTDTEEDESSTNTSAVAGRKPSHGKRRHPQLLPRERREALEAEKQMERQILVRLDRETLAMVHIDPLLRFLIQKRPVTELLYAWATTPEAMSSDEQGLMPEGQRAFRDFTNTSLQVHATQMIHRLKEVSASQTVKNECNETLHCNDEISSKLLLWQRPITGDRFTEKGSGCTEEIVHRPMVVHRESDSSQNNEDEDDNGMSNGGRDNTFDFDADSLLSGRSRASNNNDHSMLSPSSMGESPDKRSNGSHDDFQNEDVTGEAAMLISPRKRSNSIGREHRYAAAYEVDEDIGNTSAGGLYPDDIVGFGAAAGLLRDDGGGSPTASGNIHRDPFTNLEAEDEQPSPVVTRPRSRHSSAPPDPPANLEVFDESAFETRVLEDLSDSEQLKKSDNPAKSTSSASPPHYDRYLEDIPEYVPSTATIAEANEYQSDQTFPVTSESSPTHRAISADQSQKPEPQTNSSSKFTVTFASGGPSSRRSNSMTRQSPGATSQTNPAGGTDDSFELDEESIGIIEKTRGASVDSSFDSDTAEFLSEHHNASTNDVTTEKPKLPTNHSQNEHDLEHAKTKTDAEGSAEENSKPSGFNDIMEKNELSDESETNETNKEVVSDEKGNDESLHQPNENVTEEVPTSDHSKKVVGSMYHGEQSSSDEDENEEADE